MVVVSYSGKEINSKLVYYGAGLSGKTTNLESIYEAVPDTSRGKMVSMKTQSDRTLFFDLLPLNLGEIMGFKTRFLLYTVPGQVFYNATRKLVLKGADAVVFVADSEIGKMEENKESLANLRANLAEYGVRLEEVPWVLQYNKRDLENKYSIEEMQKELNPDGSVPYFEAVASQGKGVFETFRGISHMLLEKVAKDLRRTPFGGPSRRSEPAQARVEGPIAPVAPVAAPKTHDYGNQLSLTNDIRPDAPSPPAAEDAPEIVVEAAIEMPEGDIVIAKPDAEMAAERAEARRPMRKEAADSAPVRVIEPELMGRRTLKTEIRTVDGAAAQPSQPSLAAGPAEQETIIPVVLPRGGGAREIVIRIVVSQEEAA